MIPFDEARMLWWYLLANVVHGLRLLMTDVNMASDGDIRECMTFCDFPSGYYDDTRSQSMISQLRVHFLDQGQLISSLVYIY
jgi:hypothetical protein